MDMSTEIIAKELSLRNRRNAEVLLAVGLPLTRFGEERKPFIDYLMKMVRKPNGLGVPSKM